MWGATAGRAIGCSIEPEDARAAREPHKEPAREASCVHAVERHVKRGLDLPDAVRAAHKDLEGDFAFVISDREHNRLVAVKKGSDLEYAIVGAVPFQLLGYHLAVAKGMDPDYPRNLSKTLTVD
jgi:glucosamine 6-phosphate synthetase-like amidotransferase/phosphosugar isomerase protein